MIKRWGLAVGIGVLLVGQLAVGVAGAADLRADARAERAAARERAAVKAYLVQLRPLGERVYDALQPVEDAFDDFASPYEGIEETRDDVLARSGIVAALTAEQRALRTLEPPASRKAQAAAAGKAMDALLAAGKGLAAATKVKGDRSGFVRAFGSSHDQLVAAETSWAVALGSLYGGLVVPTPGPGSQGGPVRKGATHGGWIRAADRVCATSAAEAAAAPDPSTASETVAVLRAEAARIRSASTRLQRAGLPADQAPLRRRVTTLLKASERLAVADDLLARSVTTRDAATFASGVTTFRAALPAVRDLGRVLDGYGASSCAVFYDVDALLTSGATGDLTA